MLNAVMLLVEMLVMLIVTILSVIMLNVFVLSVPRLVVEAPLKGFFHFFFRLECEMMQEMAQTELQHKNNIKST